MASNVVHFLLGEKNARIEVCNRGCAREPMSSLYSTGCYEYPSQQRHKSKLFRVEKKILNKLVVVPHRSLLRFIESAHSNGIRVLDDGSICNLVPKDYGYLR
jgi:hypothetical protein